MVTQVSQLIEDITNASIAQTRGLEDINTEIGQMNRITQSNATISEESASASHELSSQANQLNEYVKTLVNIVEGERTT